MRPISVRFCCFGPYMTEQFVDFQQLQKSGLFLISGETGAGKTTILDAICYALYGRSSGGLRGDLTVMRCKLADQKDETLTEFVFESGGKQYKFVRSLKYGRKNLNDSHNCMVLEDGVYVPLFENPKATFVNKKAEELIGLTYDQFRQVIVLPQGQFERLLVSDSAEKEKILVSLFHADRWQRIAEEIYRRVAQTDGELKQEKLRIQTKLGEYGCTSTEQLAMKAQEQMERAAVLKQEAAYARKAVEDCRREKEQAMLVAREFEELAREEIQLGKLEGEQSQMDALEICLRQADTAERIRPQYLACQEARRGKLRLEGRLAAEERMLESADAALEKVRRQIQTHEENRIAREADKSRIAALEAVRELYRTLEDLQNQAAQAEKVYQQQNQLLRRAETDFDRADRLWQQSVVRQDRAIRDYQQVQEAYLQGIGSTLAQKLRAGQPCPVCGSREHPAPASRCGQQVTDAHLEQAKSAMAEAAQAESDMRQQRRHAEDKKNAAAQESQKAAQQMAVTRVTYENALSRRLPEVENTRQLEQQLEQLRKRIQQFEAEEFRLQKEQGEAVARQAGAVSRAEAAREELTAAQVLQVQTEGVWRAALQEAGIASEQAFLEADMTPDTRQRQHAALLRFRTELARSRKNVALRKEKLAEISAPDMKMVTAALETADKTYTDLNTRRALAEASLKAMNRDLGKLETQLEVYRKRRQQTDEDLDFANRLRGRSGVGLQRYVLGVMLTSVTAAANELLKNVYGGRYQLYRTDEIAGSGRKGGLELEVFDSQTNARRSVTTLSGGEKFLMALSLAIGLSTVVQAQGSGIRLEAMFIDEGFGSLDRESVNDALEVLQGIQRGSGVVGIISHVEYLAEVIPTRLEIVKGRTGSSCLLHG